MNAVMSGTTLKQPPPPAHTLQTGQGEKMEVRFGTNTYYSKTLNHSVGVAGGRGGIVFSFIQVKGSAHPFLQESEMCHLRVFIQWPFNHVFFH